MSLSVDYTHLDTSSRQWPAAASQESRGDLSGGAGAGRRLVPDHHGLGQHGAPPPRARAVGGGCAAVHPCDVVKRFQKSLRPKHISTLSAMHNLAGCISKRGGDVGDAERAYRKVVRGFRDTLWDAHPQTPRCAAATETHPHSEAHPRWAAAPPRASTGYRCQQCRMYLTVVPPPCAAAQVVWTNLGSSLAAEEVGRRRGGIP